MSTQQQIDQLRLIDQAWSGRREGEQIQEYAKRTLLYLMQFAVTAPLSDSDLELADNVARFAVCSRDISPTAIERIQETRHLIHVILRGRRAEAEILARIATKHADKPNLGPMAKLETPSPVQTPPSAKVDIAF